MREKIFEAESTMPRSRPETFELMVEAEKPSKCIRFLRFLRFLWKFFRCVFSHVSLISLVVLYCLIGAYAFEALEAAHEKEIKKSIKDVRGNVAEQLWKITKEVEVLIRENWTDRALRELKSFENNLVWMMEKEGWDGSEGEDDIQWTFAGALFYSIVVITTIGPTIKLEIVVVIILLIRIALGSWIEIQIPSREMVISRISVSTGETPWRSSTTIIVWRLYKGCWTIFVRSALKILSNNMTNEV